MRSQLLIDAIVRQTTVLIARLSTAEGARSPLGHIANEVFSGLVHELESQGVSKKVIADMFGMALRSYRQKVQRLGESATSRGETLWSAVQAYLASRESTTRAELLDRFSRDDEVSVRGILNDLVESGFVVRSGRGEQTWYRMATAEELKDVGASLEGHDEEGLAVLVWLHVYREGPASRERLRQLLPVSEAALDAALEHLVGQGRVSWAEAPGVYSAQQVLIPIGEAAGWEAAIADHHRTVLSAIAAKTASGVHVSATRDEVGGTTLTFDLWPGHPREADVRALLAATRSQVIPLWEEVTRYNESSDSASTAQSGTDEEHRASVDERQRHDAYQVHYYCGQYLVTEEGWP